MTLGEGDSTVCSSVVLSVCEAVGSRGSYSPSWDSYLLFTESGNGFLVYVFNYLWFI